jgi:GcrA cell cycle regulator
MGNTPWPKEQESILAEMWNNGCSTGEIGMAIGRNRNAVIGKAHRLGLPKHAHTSRRELMDTPRVKRVQYIKPPQVDKPLTFLEPPPAILPSSGVAFMDIKDNQCHAVLGRDKTGQRLARYCGHPVEEDSAYCPGHSALFFNAPRWR